MRITVIGATGDVGRRVTTEALSRGHDVTAVGRSAARLADLPAGVRTRTGDAGHVDTVVAASSGQDVVVSATRPSAGNEHELATVTKALLAGLAGTGTRLIAVGGAASLAVPDRPGVTAVDDPRWVAAEYRAIALACAEQHEAYRADTTVDWVYVSPPAMLVPGRRTGTYRTGRDELLVDDAGRSEISMEDFAVAVLDEIERPRHRRTRFTVAY
ncbi:NAD(P)-dependent oxidoreductase [Phytoactinopolyspora halotolerans]|uniref:NAD(P)H-binding protein n=1 Tax=Phytoactinopolyspora halotolerans TaxID=1981512 RepID=A0A6L9SBG2_9ACTN|nr:NAD(P)H-binding protein [Phytoactinopolyspora halotolerans]NEE01350.1 NAD(P)H-binding protein [Phytoactinopolyspora halotolerans]